MHLWSPGSHLVEDGLIVVDVVYAHDDLGGATEWVGPTGGIVVRGRDVEDVLGAPQPRGRASAQFDDSWVGGGRSHAHNGPTAVQPPRQMRPVLQTSNGGPKTRNRAESHLRGCRQVEADKNRAESGVFTVKGESPSCSSLYNLLQQTLWL